MKLHGLVRSVWMSVTVVTLILAICGRSTAAARIRVRGSSQIQLVVDNGSDGIRVQGVLRQDDGTALARQPVRLTLLENQHKPVAWLQLQGCQTTSTLDLEADVVTTDAQGAWCFQSRNVHPEARVQAHYAGNQLFQPTMSQALYLSKAPQYQLSFAPSSTRIDLNAPRVVILASISLPSLPPQPTSTLQTPHTSSFLANKPLLSNVIVQLLEHDGTLIASATSDEAGALFFDIPSKQLWGPGIRPLKLSVVPQNKHAYRSETTLLVTRTLRVFLTPQQTELTGDTSHGISFKVGVRTNRQLVSGGLVQAFYNGRAISTAPVRDGSALILVRLGHLPANTQTDVQLSYVAPSPYLIPSPEAVVVRLHTRTGLTWVRSLPLVIVLIVGAWLLKGWWRPKRKVKRTTRVKRSEIRPPGTASISLINERNHRKGRWYGQVVDAHDGTAVSNARLHVISISYTEKRVVVQTHADESGYFVFDLNEYRSTYRLEIDGEYHSLLGRPLPKSGAMVIHLVSRRRTLLDRLVQWTQKRDHHWQAIPEATPGHVIRQGVRSNAEDVVNWARQVEQSAYGPQVVNEQIEAQVAEMRKKVEGAR